MKPEEKQPANLFLNLVWIGAWLLIPFTHSRIGHNASGVPAMIAGLIVLPVWAGAVQCEAILALWPWWIGFHVLRRLESLYRRWRRHLVHSYSPGEFWPLRRILGARAARILEPFVLMGLACWISGYDEDLAVFIGFSATCFGVLVYLERMRRISEEDAANDEAIEAYNYGR